MYVHSRHFLQSYTSADCQGTHSQQYYMLLRNEEQRIKFDCGLDVLLLSITQTSLKQTYTRSLRMS